MASRHLPDHAPLFPAGALVLLVGPPGAGKSTLAAALVAAGEVAADDVLCADTQRQRLTGDALDTSRDRNVWARLRRDLDTRLADGRTTVVDATNLFPRRRARHLAVARTRRRPVVAIRFDEPLEVLLARNGARARTVRTGAVVEMALQMADAVSDEALLAEGVGAVVPAGEVRTELASRIGGERPTRTPPRDGWAGTTAATVSRPGRPAPGTARR
jgi:predicted kinase